MILDRIGGKMNRSKACGGGCALTTLTKIEGDFVQKPSVQVIAKIAKALDVSMEDLVK